MNILKKKDSKEKNKSKDKLPFAVFISPKSVDNENVDYKQIFTDIVSDRIKEKYK